MRLFAVKNRSTNKIVTTTSESGNSVTYFRTKSLAKTYRDLLGKDTHAVVLGPDHHRYGQ